MNLRLSGASHAAKVVEEVTLTSPTRVTEYKAAMKAATKHAIQMSPGTALSFMIETKLTKQQYLLIRELAKQHNSSIYPPYSKIGEAKERSYPQDISVSETCAEVKLQSLLDHTSRRIMEMQSEGIDQLDIELLQKFTLILKWGFDGSSGQKQYKQKFSDPDIVDTNVILTSLVPLQVTIFDDHDELRKEIVVWKNPRPSSPRFCRPIRLQFKREDKISTLEEKRYIDDQIKKLLPFQINLGGKEISVHYQLLFTIIDGKVCNTVTETASAMRCFLCKSVPSQFNDIEAMTKKKIDESELQYGLSTLHCWIRFFECLLNVGYKKELQTWQSRGKESKEKLELRKTAIRNSFKQELHSLIDFPKPGGSVNTNDGNTVRRFFENFEIAARILEIDETLIYRFYVILQVLPCGLTANVPLFEAYCLETARMFVDLYPWYKMSPTVHKVLIHVPKMIESMILPIGQLSEEAQEARNKDIRNYRENFSRKS